VAWARLYYRPSASRKRLATPASCSYLAEKAISMAIGRLFRRDPLGAPAADLYGQVVEQARRPAFYTGAGVPDTLDGRFELVALHAFLLLHRLKREGEAGAALGQAVFDLMFADMDRSLRELGAGDLGVAPRVKRMVSGFYGRIAAYEAGLADGDGALAEALRRNLYGTLRPGGQDVEAAARPAAMAVYLRAAVAALEGQPGSGLMAGRLTFPEPDFAGELPG
jgi:cytochrome b pre-mRNA-processing protein 3